MRAFQALRCTWDAGALCKRCCVYIQEIATAILQEQTPKRLYEVRGKLYELLVNCLPPELILRKLTLELFRCAALHHLQLLHFGAHGYCSLMHTLLHVVEV